MEVQKDMINQIRRIIAPCNKCPYKFGMVKTTVNPCPQCEMNNYQTYDEFMKQMLNKNKKER